MKAIDTYPGSLSLKQKKWGMVDGKPVWLFTLSRGKSMIMTVTNYGAIVQSLLIQHQRSMRDVVLGYDSLAEYIKDPYYIGCVVGRYANRISGGTITIENQDYNITTTPGGFHHHGGKKGFNKQVWTAEPFSEIDRVGISLNYTSPHMEEGFPGNLSVKVVYELNNYNEWSISYEAQTDRPTIHNLTQHTYFNLAGHNKGNIAKHELETNANHILLTNSRQLPTGELMSIKNTPFDFTSFRKIGKDIDNNIDQLLISRGYDHYFVLEEDRTNILKYGGSVKEPAGLAMDFYTSEPGFHFYTGNFLDSFFIGKKNKTYQRRSGFCIETHNFPDAPNHALFPSAILQPGVTYKSRTVFKFKKYHQSL